MKNILFCLALIFGFISCKKSSTATESNSKIDSVITNESITRTNSTNEANFKVDNDSVKIVGERILNGEYIGGKNEKYIFPLMDSLNQKGENSRQFYFKVFGKIVEQSDGYISEAIGSRVLSYFKSFPKEFIQNSELINDSTFKSMAYYAADEIGLSNVDKPKAMEEFQKLKTEILKRDENLSEPNKRKLDLFFKYAESRLNSTDYY